MSDASLRAELEAVYTAAAKALAAKDIQAFLANVHGVEEAEIGGESDFAEALPFLQDMLPPLASTTFVAVAQEGDLAGYYQTAREGKAVNVTLLPFVKDGDAWKLVLQGASYAFEPEAGEDVDARVRELIATEDMLQLRAPDAQSGPPTEAMDMDVRAAINCMAYDYELRVAINGVPLDVEGGKSESRMLFGLVAGAEPQAPAVLHVGSNDIQIDYRKTEGGEMAVLTVEITVLPDRPSFRFISADRPSGSVSRTFTVPGSDDEEVAVVEISDDGT